MEKSNKEKFDRCLSRGGFDVYLTVGGGVVMEVTDGDYDRAYRVEAAEAEKWIAAAGGFEQFVALFPMDKKSDFYIALWKELCEKHGIRYEYTSWFGSGCYDRQ